MPLEVIMPALGMAQDSGVLVAWHKAAGDAVAEGDVLFEVETDKATMEVEAQGAGYLVDVAVEAGAEVPVGQVIARIAETPEATEPAGPDKAAESPAAASGGAAEELPEGQVVIMPTLGMSQDTGLLVSWLKSPGEAVAADDVLFEVETDKSTVEVPAGADGYVAAQLAEAGEEVPVGQTIAIISAQAPDNPVVRIAAPAMPAADAVPAMPAAEPAGLATTEATAAETPAGRPGGPRPEPRTDGRILASPKARRLAMKEGLDLGRLAEAGYPQPYHARDVETLKSLPVSSPAGVAGATPCQITARVNADGQAGFLQWMQTETGGAPEPGALWAAFAAAALREAGGGMERLAVELAPLHGPARVFADPDLAGLSALTGGEADQPPDLRLRDPTGSPITGLSLGAPACPVLTVSREGDALILTLDFTAPQLEDQAALAFLTGFAGRLEEPLRHLL